MNKPTPSIAGDDDFGPVDEHGMQIWSPGEAASIDRVTSNAGFQAAIARADADFAAGRVRTHEEVVAMSAERRRRYRAERGL